MYTTQNENARSASLFFCIPGNASASRFSSLGFFFPIMVRHLQHGNDKFTIHLSGSGHDRHRDLARPDIIVREARS